MADLQIVVSVPPGQSRTYHVNKPELTIGRFPGSDIVLYDSQASRQHARLRALPTGYEIEDLGSTNGTWLNGQSVTRALVQIGDSIAIGDSKIHLEAASQPEASLAAPQTVSELTRAVGAQQVEIELHDQTRPRLVIHTQSSTWETALTGDAAVIGRDAGCQIVIPDMSVSRQHARLVPEGEGYVLVDLNSRNGTVVRGQRISRYPLRPGDMIQIGTGTLVYQGPVDQAAATRMIDQPLKSPRGGRRPVVFVPGFMGSELWRGSEQIWPNVSAMFTHPEWYRWPSKEPIEARRLVSEMVVVPNFIKLERHNELGDFLTEGLGYERGKDFMEFPWDWRLDLRVVAQQLCEQIAQWRQQAQEVRQPITIIAHSMGCLVARYYVEKLGGGEAVNRMILIGGPHRGTPKTLQAFAAFGRQSIVYTIAEPFQRAIASLPSTYTMLPSYPAVFNSAGQAIDLHREESWCPEGCRPLLRNALAFRQELGMACSVSTICIFGYGVQTPARAVLEDRDQRGGWQRIRFYAENKGDNTVPEESAHLPGTEIHPIYQHHGALYADNDVKMRLRLELAS